MLEEARGRNLFFVDATCPLVSKVHVEAARQHARGLEVVLIGHAGHPEVIGTMGQLPAGAVRLVESQEQARRFGPREPSRLAYVTQTTLSVDDTARIIEILRARFPQIVGPYKEDICYATTNRQAAVKAIASRCDKLIVVGAPNSSNSRRLVEAAVGTGCGDAVLVQRAADIDWDRLADVRTLGLTASASAPEVLVDEIVAAARERFDVRIETVATAEERVTFKLPPELREPEAA